MTNRDRILATLSRITGPVCDDCLSEKAGVTPCQTVFASQ